MLVRVTQNPRLPNQLCPEQISGGNTTGLTEEGLDPNLASQGPASLLGENGQAATIGKAPHSPAPG